MKTLTPLDLMTNPKLFEREFAAPSWDAWKTFLAALCGQRLTPTQRALYRQCTGRTTPPTVPAREAYVLVGRRGGKSLIAALCAVFCACFRSYPSLRPGEVGTVLILAADRRQARVIFGHVRHFLTSVPVLRHLIVHETKDTVTVEHHGQRIAIEIHTSSFRSVRGYTVIAAVLDELCFWMTDDTSANPDTAVRNAILPAMATIPDALLLSISSPYAKKGVMFEQFSKHYGQDGDPVLVWKAATRTMNATVPESIITAAYEQDPESAGAEYGAEWRDDLSTFLPLDVVQACVVSRRIELPPRTGVRYVAAVDPSGGRSDSFTLAIAHRDGTTAVLDCIREAKPPFVIDTVVAEFATLLHDYDCAASVIGDAYAGEWPTEAFARQNVTYTKAPWNKSVAYLNCLPWLNAGLARVELLDHKRIMSQFANLERRTRSGGADSVSEPPGHHDDVANVVALVLNAILLRQKQEIALSGDDFAMTQEERDAEMQRRNRAFADAIRAKGSWNLGD